MGVLTIFYRSPRAGTKGTGQDPRLSPELYEAILRPVQIKAARRAQDLSATIRSQRSRRHDERLSPPYGIPDVTDTLVLGTVGRTSGSVRLSRGLRLMEEEIAIDSATSSPLRIIGKGYRRSPTLLNFLLVFVELANAGKHLSAFQLHSIEACGRQAKRLQDRWRYLRGLHRS